MKCRFKGFVAHAKFDDTINTFHGSVVNSRAVITFEAESVAGLQKEFQESVEQYLAWCERDGLAPDRLPSSS